jgi:hypothetical protein
VRILLRREGNSAKQGPGRRDAAAGLGFQRPTPQGPEPRSAAAAPGRDFFALRPLTVFDAEAEARWRWGGLLTHGLARYSAGHRNPFEVGTRLFGSVKIRGRGTSWEGAFRDACAPAAIKAGAT